MPAPLSLTVHACTTVLDCVRACAAVPACVCAHTTVPATVANTTTTSWPTVVGCHRWWGQWTAAELDEEPSAFPRDLVFVIQVEEGHCKLLMEVCVLKERIRAGM